MSICILCPKCRKKMSKNKGGYKCSKCKKEFKIKKGILRLRENAKEWDYKIRTDKIPKSFDKWYTKFFNENVKRRFRNGLDFGCGSGKSAMSFEKIVDKYYCLEPSLDGLTMFHKRKNFDANKFKLINQLGGIPFQNNTFDFASMISVYEHIKQPNKFLKEINRVLKNRGGFFIVNDTLAYYILEKLHILKKKADPTHIFMKTPNYLEKELKRNNFKIIKRGHLPFSRWGIKIPKFLSFLSTKGVFICEKR